MNPQAFQIRRTISNYLPLVIALFGAGIAAKFLVDLFTS